MVCVYSQSAVPLRTTPAILVKHSFKIDRFLVIHLHTPLISHLLFIPLHFLYFLLFLLGCFLVCILLLTTEVLFSLTSAGINLWVYLCANCHINYFLYRHRTSVIYPKVKAIPWRASNPTPCTACGLLLAHRGAKELPLLPHQFALIRTVSTSTVSSTLFLI